MDASASSTMDSMTKAVRKVSDYTVLALTISSFLSKPTTSKHYLYLRPHDPKLPDPDSSRSIFIANIPIDSTEQHFRSLFSGQIAGGRVERVEFEVLRPTRKRTSSTLVSKTKKRKRNVDTQNLEFDLPETWDRTAHTSGSTAVVVFVDRASMELSLKAARKAVKAESQIVWTDGPGERIPTLGSRRYLAHHQLTYPSPEDLSEKVDAYMTSFAELESARVRALARQRQVPDEDGFVTVTRGGRTGPARNSEAQERLQRQRKRAEEKRRGMEDFYRFQIREKRKEEAGELKRKFEEDLRKVEEMRKGNKARFTPMGV